MNQNNKLFILITVFVLVNFFASAQIATPISPSIDTLYMSSGSMTPTIDPNPRPSLTDSSTRFGRTVANDDPGGPGSGGSGGFNPPADAAIPLDGGVGGLLLAGALIGLKRSKKDKNLL